MQERQKGRMSRFANHYSVSEKKAVYARAVGSYCTLLVTVFASMALVDNSEKVSSCDISNNEKAAGDELGLALDCISDRFGKIAVIGYGDGLSLDQLAIASADADSILARGTGGLVDVTMVSMLASQSANERFNQLNPECASKDIEKLGSFIAKDEMNLRDYNYVVSVTDVKQCQGGHGLASGDFADVFDVHEDVKPKDFETKDEYKDTLADVIAHEAGHLYKLGHMSKLEHSSYHNLSSNNSGVIDLSSIISSIKLGAYREYDGQNNLMGQHTNQIEPDAYQAWYLQWPERALKLKPDTHYPIDQKETLVPNSDKSRNFSSLKFSEPLKIVVRQEGLGVREMFYDRLLFEQKESRVHVSLVNDNDVATLSLGYIHFSNQESSTRIIKINTYSVRIEYQSDRGIFYTDISKQEKT